MKIIISALSIGLIAFFAESLSAWWIGAIVALIVAAVAQLKPPQAFLAGFLGLGILWGISAGIINAQNDGILATRIGGLLGGISPSSIVAVTALIGALIGGLGALVGASAMKLLIAKPTVIANGE